MTLGVIRALWLLTRDKASANQESENVNLTNQNQRKISFYQKQSSLNPSVYFNYL